MKNKVWSYNIFLFFIVVQIYVFRISFQVYYDIYGILVF